MTALAKKLGRFRVTGLTISIAAPSATMALNVTLTGHLGEEHFFIEVTPIEAPALSEPPQAREVGGELPGRERDAREDVYGENGERMPYHPARSRQSRPGGLACEPPAFYGGLDQFC